MLGYYIQNLEESLNFNLMVGDRGRKRFLEKENSTENAMNPVEFNSHGLANQFGSA